MAAQTELEKSMTPAELKKWLTDQATPGNMTFNQRDAQAALFCFLEMCQVSRTADEIVAEVNSARSTWPQFNSAHEGFAVLLEEVDELKAHVWTKQKNRDLRAMHKEAIQVAAMAVRFAEECCDEVSGRK